MRLSYYEQLVADAKTDFASTWETGGKWFDSQDWNYWRAAHALETLLTDLKRLDQAAKTHKWEYGDELSADAVSDDLARILYKRENETHA